MLVYDEESAHGVSGPGSLLKNLAGRDIAIWNMDCIWGDVDVLEEVLCHEAVVRLQGVWIHGKVLVQVESSDIAERKPRFVCLDQLPVDVHGGGACG